MEDEKKLDPSEFAKFFENTTNESNFCEEIWPIIFLILMFGFFPLSNSTESYLKGKIEAYENILKGFDDYER